MYVLHVFVSLLIMTLMSVKICRNFEVQLVFKSVSIIYYEVFLCKCNVLEQKILQCKKNYF